MRAVETHINVREVGEAILTLPKDISPGKYKVVLVVYEEKEDDFSLSPEIDRAYKVEIDKRLKDNEKNPQPDFTMEEVIQRMETRIGRKIQIKS
jgi:tetrahydromethanopterin S-methyltransferase subunit G